VEAVVALFLTRTSVTDCSASSLFHLLPSNSTNYNKHSKSLLIQASKPRTISGTVKRPTLLLHKHNWCKTTLRQCYLRQSQPMTPTTTLNSWGSKSTNRAGPPTLQIHTHNYFIKHSRMIQGHFEHKKMAAAAHPTVTTLTQQHLSKV
jgi:hypothetical protein